MSDCPLCEWRYDPYGAAVLARPVGRPAPIVWDGTLRVVSLSEPPRGKPEAAGAHMCFDHPLDPEVLLMGPAEEWRPLAELNAALHEWAAQPLWRRAFGF